MKIRDADGKQSVGWLLHATGGVSVAIVIGAYYCFFYQGLALSQEVDTQRIDQLSLLLSESAAVQRANNRLQEDLGALERSVAAIRQRLPHELRQEEFAADLSRAAEAVGLHLDELHWGIPKVSPSHAQAEIKVDCSGSYASMCRFLDEVTRLARVTDVAQLQIDSEPESAIHTFQVSFILYYDVDAPKSDKNEGVL